jgi:hypothetical protein
VPQGEPQALPVRASGAVAGQHLGHAAQQLGEDRPGVPAGTDEGAVRHRPGRVGERRAVRAGRRRVPGEDRLDGRDGRLHGQIQVRAGVPVRDRIDVDRVDLLTRPPQGLERETAPGAHRESIEECLRHLRHRASLSCWTWHAA